MEIKLQTTDSFEEAIEELLCNKLDNFMEIYLKYQMEASEMFAAIYDYKDMTVGISLGLKKVYSCSLIDEFIEKAEGTEPQNIQLMIDELRRVITKLEEIKVRDWGNNG